MAAATLPVVGPGKCARGSDRLAPDASPGAKGGHDTGLARRFPVRRDAPREKQRRTTLV